MCVYYEYTVLSNSIFSTFGDKKTYSESITKHSKPLKSFGWLFFFAWFGLGLFVFKSPSTNCFQSKAQENHQVLM